MKKIILSVILLFFIFVNSVLAQDQVCSREQRVYALSIIWKELSYNFAFPEKLKQANMDSLYLAYLPKVEQAKDNFEYYRTLSSFMAHFNEAHTRIYASKRMDDVPPIKVKNCGGKIIVENIERNQVHAVPVGSEILKINDISVLQYIQDSVSLYISSATPQWKFDKSVLELFSGRPGSAVKITVKTPQGKTNTIRMIRNYYANSATEIMADTSRFCPVDIKILEKNIGYIHLKTCAGNYVDTINLLFNRSLPKLMKCKGLIIDLRGNRGGSDEAWENIAFHLFRDSVMDIPAKYFSRINVAAYKNWGENSQDVQLRDYYEGKSMYEISHSPYKNKVADSLKLYQPLIILSGQHVASSAEDFLLLLKGSGRARVLGEPSVGCVGEPMFVPLGGGLELMLSVKKYVCLDGTQPNDKGIEPDVYVKSDYNAFLEGKDNILEQGIRELKK